MSSTNVTDTPSEVSANSTTQTEGLSTFTEVLSTPKVAVSDSSGVPKIDPQLADSILLREHYLMSFVVNGTEIFNANLFAAYDPFNAFISLAKVQDVIKNFAFIRGDLVVTARITPPGSCFGAMVFSAICEGGMDATPNASVNTVYADDLVRDSLFTSFNDMFQVINFEQASTVSLELPFVYHSHYISTSPGSTWMWRLQLQSMVPLQSTISTTAAAEIRIYASMKPGYELAVPTYQSKKPVTNTAGFGGKKKGAISDVSSQVANLASSVSGYIPALAPFTTPIAAGASAISAVASFFGFTRESSFIPPDTVVPRYFANTSLVDGVDTSDSVVALSGACLSLDPAIGEGEHSDPLCFESIRQRWGCIAAFTLSTSTPSGNMIYSLPVTPFYSGVNLGVVYMTPGGYYGLPYAKWRGGMEYLIYIPSSSNMRGMLQICYNADVDNGPFPHVASDPTGSVHTVSLDLSGTQQHLIQVPYASPSPCKDAYVTIDTSAYGRGIGAVNGSLDFYLSAAWVAPRAGVVSTRVVILARPMADMVYADYKGRIPELQALNSVRYQSLVDESVNLIETTILGQAVEQEFDLAASCVSEVAPSARALLQKFTRIYTTAGGTADDSNAGFRIIQHLNPMHNGGSGPDNLQTGNIAGGTSQSRTLSNFTYLKFYSMLFVGVRGGTRAKIILDVAESALDGTDVLAFHVPNEQRYAASNNWDATHMSVQRLDPTHAAEFAFPYVSERLYLNPRYFPQGIATPLTGPISGLGQRTLVVGGPSLLTPKWSLWYAGSSDISVTRFRRVPGIVAAALVVP